MNSDNFFIDLKLPIVVHEANPKDAIEFAQWIGESYDQNPDGTWGIDLKRTTEELYKIYQNAKTLL
jgi:hypothetical protein